jgi:HrpA-like RNA helicase
LITFNTFESLSAHSVPEMLRAPLENLVLQVKAMNLKENLFDLLKRCPDPPLRSSIVIAENILKSIQALDQTGELTSLGQHLSTLPCDPKIGRLLIYGALFGCTYAASAVGACLTNRSPFITAPSNSTEAILKESVKTMFSKLSGCHRSVLVWR